MIYSRTELVGRLKKGEDVPSGINTEKDKWYEVMIVMEIDPIGTFIGWRLGDTNCLWDVKQLDFMQKPQL